MAIEGNAAAEFVERPVRIRTIDPGDLTASLKEGWADFKARRGDLLMLGFLYPIVGFLAALASLDSFRLDLLFPIFAGLTLLGPLVATGFYEIAKRREAGDETGWSHFFDVVNTPSFPAMLGVGAGLFILFGLWMLAAAAIYTLFLGTIPETLDALFALVLGTAQGWQMMLVGNIVGFLFAVAVLAVAPVSLPMLVDRDVSAATAVRASYAAFRANTGVMLRWGFTVAALLFIGAIPLLIGLAVVVPVLGYSTWHLYTRIVDRDALQE